MAWIFGVEWIFGWITIERIGPAKGFDLFSLSRQLGLALGLMLLVGISEEVLSRGYHLKNLSEGLRCLGRWPAVILAVLLSSAVFGLLHAFNPAATWISNLGVGLAGVMLATARVATGSLAGPIGLHIAWNLVQGPILGFPVSGNQFHQSLIEITQAGDALWTGGAFGPEAGLLGCMACVALTGVCLVWGKTKLTSTRSLSNLVRYRRSAYAARNLEKRALKARALKTRALKNLELETRELEERSTDV